MSPARMAGLFREGSWTPLLALRAPFGLGGYNLGAVPGAGNGYIAAPAAKRLVAVD